MIHYTYLNKVPSYGWAMVMEAADIFLTVQVKNVVFWTSFIAGHVEFGCDEKALSFLEDMRLNGISPNEVTYVCCLKACGNGGGNAKKLQELHVDITKQGFEKDTFIQNALVDVYGRFGLLLDARNLFDEVSDRDVVTWTALIAGYAQHGSGKEVFHYLDQMQYEGLCPNEVTFACILQACGNIGALKKGMEIHAAIMKGGSFRSNNVLGTALMDMYAKCGNIAKAQAAFEDLAFQDMVSWTALIGGYAQCRQGKEAIICFQRMQLESLIPNSMTFIYVLKACGNTKSTKKGKEIHAGIIRREENNIYGSALVDMYARCGELVMAQNVFDKLHEHDIVSWTALMLGYTDHGHGDEALKCYELSHLEGLFPNAVTFACILKACGSIGAVDKAEEIHGEITRGKFLEKSMVLGSALIDTYAKCGVLTKAQLVFDELSVHNVVSWTSLIAGHAQLGKHDIVFDLFHKMVGEGIKPNAVTFIVLLNSCSDAGLVNEGQLYFDAMSSYYGISPALEHFTCMVDLFGRIGQLEQAVLLVNNLPFSEHLIVWNTLLGACKKEGDVELARSAFEHVIQLDDMDSAAYICIWNIYANITK